MLVDYCHCLVSVSFVSAAHQRAGESRMNYDDDDDDGDSAEEGDDDYIGEVSKGRMNAGRLYTAADYDVRPSRSNQKIVTDSRSSRRRAANASTYIDDSHDDDDDDVNVTSSDSEAAMARRSSSRIRYVKYDEGSYESEAVRQPVTGGTRQGRYDTAAQLRVTNLLSLYLLNLAMSQWYFYSWLLSHRPVSE